MRTLIPIVVVLSAAASAPLGAADCFQDWWQARLVEVESLRSSAPALLPLRQIESLRQTATDPDEILTRYEALRDAPDTDPLLAAELDAILLWSDLGRGRFELAAQRRARLGLIESWWVAGPLGTASTPPTQPLAARQITTGPSGLLPLDHLITPSQNARAEATAWIELTAAADVAIRFGVDDAARLTIDGVPVFGTGEPPRHELAFDQHAVFVRLDAGWHQLAFETIQVDDGWGLTARLTTPDGAPLGSVWRRSASDAAGRESAIAALAARRKPGVKLLSRGRTLTGALEAAARGGDPRARSAYALDLHRRRLPARTDNAAIALAREAVDDAPTDPLVLAVLAEIDDDPARARQSLQRALEITPRDPALLRGLIHYHSNFSQSREALAVTERALAVCRDPYLEIWRAVARDGGGFPAGVLAALGPLAERFPRQPVLWKQLAQFARREWRLGLARHALERSLALAGTDDAAREDLVNLLLDAGATDEALAVLDAGRAIFPHAQQLAARRARLLQRLGRHDEALAAVDAALAFAPGQPQLTVLRGEILLGMGRAEEAAAAFAAARPTFGEEGALDQRIAAITGQESGFGREWTVTLDAARAIESATPIAGDPAWLVLSQTSAWRVQADGRSEQFQQLIARIRHPQRAEAAKVHSVTYTPALQRASVIEARIVRQDGTVIPAQRGEQPVLPDPELRMWYDSRALGVSFPRFEAGDLIEISFSISDRGPGNPVGAGYFGDLFPVGSLVPVLSTRLVIDASSERPVQHRLVNLTGHELVRRESRDGRQLTVVEIPPQPALPPAPLQPPPLELIPYAVLGTTPDWAALGTLYSRLIADAMVLDSDARAVVHDLTAHTFSRREIVKVLYRWVIENTRYVALEFGINAIKPYAAPLVYKRRHGDCKDKAALLVAMLREAGVKAQVALVRTRDRGRIDTAVPVFAAFDHAIVYVPGENLWLDGTVLFHGVDELPTQDRGIQALLIDPESGGTLTSTTGATPEDAALSRTEELRLDATGIATISADVSARGERAALARSVLGGDEPGRTLQTLLRRSVPELNLISADFPQLALEDREVRYSYRARLPRFGSGSGDGNQRRIDAPLSYLLPELPLGPPAIDRSSPLRLPSPSFERVESTLIAPPGARFAAVPQAGVVDSPWGSVALEVRPSGARLSLAIELKWHGGDVPPAELGRLAQFLEAARQLLQQRTAVELP